MAAVGEKHVAVDSPATLLPRERNATDAIAPHEPAWRAL